MEYFDIIDQNENIIGKATREECHSNKNLIHRTVQFTLIDIKNKKVLITKRSLKKKHDAGKICFLGEHVMSGESLEDAVLRGCLEELDFNANETILISKNLFEQESQTELVYFYLVPWDGSELKNLDETEWIKFVDYKELNLENDDYDFSDMTSHWIEAADWEKYLKY